MAHWILIAAGAGVAAAAMFASAATGSLTAVLLANFVSLPLFIAGLGWGSLAAGLAGIAGSALLCLVSLTSALVFLIAAAFAPVVLSHLALLSRPASGPARTMQPQRDGEREWYPEGSLVAWTALLAGGVAAAGMLLIAREGPTFSAALQATLKAMIERHALLLRQVEATGLDLDGFVAVLAAILPPLSAIVWFATYLVNFALAARALQLSGHAPRPWAPFSRLALPTWTAPALATAAAAVFLAGVPGLIGATVAGALGAAFTLLGLAVAHALSEASPARALLLATVYGALILFNWLAMLALALLGLIEIGFGLRARSRASAGPPAGG
jgi:hypothetical protein